jgi:hypothetical protein
MHTIPGLPVNQRWGRNGNPLLRRPGTPATALAAPARSTARLLGDGILEAIGVGCTYIDGVAQNVVHHG